MRIVDANVLIYANRSDALHHSASLAWLNKALSGADVVGLTWPVLLAYVRIVTNPRVSERPAEPAIASDQVALWLSSPNARLLAPGAGHAAELSRQVAQAGTAGNLTNDAHLAALAVEHRAEIVSYDTDFERFPDIRWRRPDDLL